MPLSSSDNRSQGWQQQYIQGQSLSVKDQGTLNEAQASTDRTPDDLLSRMLVESSRAEETPEVPLATLNASRLGPLGSKCED
ncbi:MAG: hypothetical protein SWL02_06460 [Pseudomonadota bacterium]|nr:hypothetical protein [Pseudomonadota bacterium]